MATTQDNASERERTLAELEMDFEPAPSAIPSIDFLRGHIGGLSMAGNDGVELTELRRWTALLLDEVEQLRVAVTTSIGSMQVGGRTLTPMERQLFRYLRDTGLTMAEIAAARFVSINTVKTQARSLYRKLGVSKRVQLNNMVID